MRPLIELTEKELEALAAEYSQPPFRAKQLGGYILKGTEISDMTSLPKAFREALENAGAVTLSVRVEKIFESAADGTRKYLFALGDGNIVEGVLMRYSYGNTLCVSTQVGCAMGCRFCASTLEGKIRDLTASEMLSMVAAADRDNARDGKRGVTNVVLMGSGEPLDNYAQVVAFLRRLCSDKGLGISRRNVSLSTCGLCEKIRTLAGEDCAPVLTVSLHAPDDDIRRTIMPIANRYTIKEVVDAAEYYFKKTSRRVIFEYSLIRGVNDTKDCARKLSALLRGFPCHVNLIKLNRVPERGLEGSDAHTVKAFSDELTRLGTSNTVRRTLGSDIDGACGQLRRRYLSDGGSCRD